jgi:hypothetical protein
MEAVLNLWACRLIGQTAVALHLGNVGPIPTTSTIYLIEMPRMATYSKDFLAQLDCVNPDKFIASSIGFRSSAVRRTEIPGDRAFDFAIFGLPAFLVIK